MRSGQVFFTEKYVEAAFGAAAVLARVGRALVGDLEVEIAAVENCRPGSEECITAPAFLDGYDVRSVTVKVVKRLPGRTFVGRVTIRADGVVLYEGVTDKMAKYVVHNLPNLVPKT